MGRLKCVWGNETAKERRTRERDDFDALPVAACSGTFPGGRDDPLPLWKNI